MSGREQRAREDRGGGMRPAPGEYPDIYERYVSLLTQDRVVPVLNAQANAVHDALSGLSDERASWRYAPEKWSVRELLGHVIDTERVFGFAHCRSRGASSRRCPPSMRTPTPGSPGTTGCQLTSSPKSSPRFGGATC